MSSSPARTGSRLDIGLSPYSYTLVEFMGSHGRSRHTSFPTLQALAVGVFAAASAANAARHWPDSIAASWPRHHLQAFDAAGKTFDTCELASWGKRLAYEGRSVSRYFLLRRAPVPGYRRRAGPVPGVHKLHAYCWHRAPKTMNERRSNEVSYQRDEGEPLCRPRRTGYALPSDRDDLPRCVERCWKAQHKGRKSWDK